MTSQPHQPERVAGLRRKGPQRDFRSDRSHQGEGIAALEVSNAAREAAKQGSEALRSAILRYIDRHQPDTSAKEVVQ